MKRYKSIDIIRGIAVFGMVFGHILNWWIIPKDYWLYLFVYYALGPIAAGGFLFLSGMSGIFAYKKSLIMVDESEDFSINMVRNGYLLRALLLLLIAFLYNIPIAIAINDLTWIWAWFVLQTIAFSLLLAWPFLRTTKIFRIIFGTAILIINFIVLELLKPFQGQYYNIYGILYHILYNPLDLYPIIPFFVIFLMGTVAGEILYEINLIEEKHKRNHAFKNKFIFPYFIIGICLTVFAILFQFPSFFTYSSFSAIVYAIGIICLIVSAFIWIEEFELIKTKRNYNLFYYYSYYSFTIFLVHNFLYLLFYQSLNAITIWIPIIATMFLFTLLLRFTYKKLGPKASLKAGIGILSLIIAIKIEQRKYVRIGKIESALDLGKLLKFGEERKN
ncbi:MAG: heparan-alpha-glucosaminide N-acetyltransferase domain-containing protein [Promethearchaeota archaeon]